jgi:hypothetical protein
LRRARRRLLAAGTLIAALWLVAGSLAIAQIRRYPDKLTPVSILASPIRSFDNRDRTLTRFGQLEFRGGLELASKSPLFGGLSSIHLDAQGSRLIGVTDRGAWLSARIAYRAGRPAGIVDAEMAPILGPDGRLLAERGWYDAEALAERDGTFYVGIERVEQIVRFDLARDGATARGEPITVPPDFKSFIRNKGLECLAVSPRGAPHAGALIAITWRKAGSHALWSGAAANSMSPTVRSCRRQTCCCWSGAFRSSPILACASAGFRLLPSRLARWSTAAC